MWQIPRRLAARLRARRRGGFFPPPGDTNLDQGGNWKAIYVGPQSVVTIRQPALLQTSGSVWIDGEVKTAAGVDLDIQSGGHLFVGGTLRTAGGTAARPAGDIRLTAHGQMEIPGLVQAGDGAGGADALGEGMPTETQGQPGGDGGDTTLRAGVLLVKGVVRSGNGGEGGKAEATLMRDLRPGESPDAAARGGDGGHGGVVFLSATRTRLRAGAVVRAGDGGPSGGAFCRSPLGAATATAGQGGRGGDVVVSGARATDGPFVPGSGGRAGEDPGAEAIGRIPEARHEAGGNAGRLTGTGAEGPATHGGGGRLRIEVEPNAQERTAEETDAQGPRKIP